MLIQTFDYETVILDEDKQEIDCTIDLTYYAYNSETPRGQIIEFIDLLAYHIKACERAEFVGQIATAACHIETIDEVYTELIEAAHAWHEGFKDASILLQAENEEWKRFG